MTKDEALQLALKALKADMAWLETDAPTEIWEKNNEAITAIKEALETEKGLLDRKSYLLGLYDQKSRLELETKDEPVAWMSEDEHTVYTSKQVDGCFQHDHIPLYTTPQRKPLTREDIDRLHEEDCFSGNIYEITAEIEAAHGIKE